MELSVPPSTWQIADAQKLAHPQSFVPSESFTFQDFGQPLLQEPLALPPSAVEPSSLKSSEIEPFGLDPLELDSFPLLNQPESLSQKQFVETQELNDFMIKVTERLDR